MVLLLEIRPVVAKPALELVEATEAEHDVVAAEALHAVAGGAAIEHVIAADQWHLAGGRTVVANQKVAAVAAGEPIIALVADERVVVLAAEDDVIAVAAIEGIEAHAAIHEVVAFAAEDDVVADTGVDDVVALLRMDDVVAGLVGDGVVAGAAVEDVVAVAAVDGVVAAVAPDRVVIGLAGNEAVGLLGAAEHHGVAEEVVVTDEMHGAVGQHLDQQCTRDRIAQPGRGIGGDAVAIDVVQEVAGEILEEVVTGLDRVLGRIEDGTRDVLGAGVVDDHLGERVALDLRAPVQAFDARQVIEPVAVLQVLELRLEDEVEGRAEQAAEQVLLLGEAADPQVDVVEARDVAVAPLGVHGNRIVDVGGVGAEAVHEVVGIGPLIGLVQSGGDEVQGGGALVRQRGGAEDRGMRTVGGDEVDQRAGMLEELAELSPVFVGLERRVAGRVEELVAQQVERRHAGFAAARDVDGREVERQPEQVIA